MARTVVAIFNNFQNANDAVRELVDNGFPRDKISVIANNSQGNYGYYAPGKTTAEGTVADETGAGAGVGAGIGAAIGGIGGLLVGLGALTIPGIGPVIAAGPLAVALSTLTGAGVGAVAGGVTGGLLGALIGLGVPEDEAEYYAEGVRRGGVLVTVQADEYNADQITSILNRHDPMDIHSQVSQWRTQGWKGFDPNSKPYSSDELQQERSQRPIANTGADAPVADTALEAGRAAPTDATVRVPSQSISNDAQFDPNGEVFRNHYTTYLAGSGYQYDYFIPAYQYGYSLRTNPRFEGLSWQRVESEVQPDWENRYPGTWERFKSAIRYGWEGDGRTGTV